jgi:hypothetical protein
VFGGNWLARDGALSTVPASGNGAKALAVATSFTNFTYEGDVRVGPVGDAGLIFRVGKPDIGADAYEGYYVGINAEKKFVELGCANNSWRSITNVPLPVAANTVYRLKVQTLGPRIRIFFNNNSQPAIDLHDSTFASGMLGVRNYCGDGDKSSSSFANLEATEFTKSTSQLP